METVREDHTQATRHDPSTPADAPMRLCVLASGSSGNCTVLVRNHAGRRRVSLIDAGLSPRRTARLLAERSIRLHEVEDVLLTHLDTDHLHPGWVRGTRDVRAVFRLHKRHTGRAERCGLLTRRCTPFDEAPFDLSDGLRISPMLVAHDSLGVAAFRFETTTPGRAATLGLATDVGRITQSLVDHLRSVDVLAIESNYCPQMQADSDRPIYLKHRITGGSGHLSNEQCAEAVRAIRPASHVVLLHLSRQCNQPDLASRPHRDSPYQLTVTSQDEPSPWVAIRHPDTPPTETPITEAASPFERTLFDRATQT